MNIKYLAMDVDGTLTDGKIYIGQDGECVKAFNVKDGYGIKELIHKYEIKSIIMTGRDSVYVSKRSKELKIDFVCQCVVDKLSKLYEILPYKEDIANVAYIGDDLNDYEVMVEIKKKGGVVGCPSDAVKEILEISDFVAFKEGGQGAVREFIDWIILNNN